MIEAIWTFLAISLVVIVTPGGTGGDPTADGFDLLVSEANVVRERSEAGVRVPWWHLAIVHAAGD